MMSVPIPSARPWPGFCVGTIAKVLIFSDIDYNEVEFKSILTNGVLFISKVGIVMRKVRVGNAGRL